jgi:hypothetical protein
MRVWYVYAMMTNFPGSDCMHVKIGVTSDPEKRLSTIRTAVPSSIWIQRLIPCTSRHAAFALEKRLHSDFSDSRQGGEWFVLTRGMNDLLGIGEAAE